MLGNMINMFSCLVDKLQRSMQRLKLKVSSQARLGKELYWWLWLYFGGGLVNGLSKSRLGLGECWILIVSDGNLCAVSASSSLKIEWQSVLYMDHCYLLCLLFGYWSKVNVVFARGLFDSGSLQSCCKLHDQ